MNDDNNLPELIKKVCELHDKFHALANDPSRNDRQEQLDEAIKLMRAQWVQKQFQDLMTAREVALDQLKRNKFNIMALSLREKTEHDLKLMEGLLLECGVEVAEIFERSHNFKFKFITKRVEEVAPDPSENLKKV